MYILFFGSQVISHFLDACVHRERQRHIKIATNTHYVKKLQKPLKKQKNVECITAHLVGLEAVHHGVAVHHHPAFAPRVPSVGAQQQIT